MEAQIIEQLMTESLSNVNIEFVVLLMAVGLVIKHFPALDKVENNLIPPVLLVLSVIASFIENGFTIHAVVIAVVSASVAIGLHQQGKNIFAPIFNSVTNVCTGLFKPHENKVETEVEPEIEVEPVEEENE